VCYVVLKRFLSPSILKRLSLNFIFLVFYTRAVASGVSFYKLTGSQGFFKLLVGLSLSSRRARRSRVRIELFYTRAVASGVSFYKLTGSQGFFKLLVGFSLSSSRSEQRCVLKTRKSIYIHFSKVFLYNVKNSI
jgi:hypothetical protein